MLQTEYISRRPPRTDILPDVSELRIEKRRAEAALKLSTGAVTRGCFFLAGSRANQSGPERVADLLNAEGGFFPFEVNGEAGPHTVLYHRAQVVEVTLLQDTAEAQRDPGYAVATERHVRILLSTGQTLVGRVRVHLPEGRNRLSDYARVPEAFRYVETADGTLIVNSAHIVEFRETSAT